MDGPPTTEALQPNNRALKPPKVRQTPRLSVRGLAEYMVASIGRQRTILTDQKFPSDFQVIFYGPVEDAISKCLVSGTRDEESLDATIRELRAFDPSRRYDLTRQQSCIDAIESFRSWLRKNTPRFPGAVRASKRQAEMKIGGVAVSVRPELLLLDNGSVVGALKLYLSKARLEKDGAGYATTLVHRYVERTLNAGSATDPTRCFVFDVRGVRLWSASRTANRRNRELEIACGNISLIWPTLPMKPPRKGRD